jgi:hypothetical protein
VVDPHFTDLAAIQKALVAQMRAILEPSIRLHEQVTAVNSAHLAATAPVKSLVAAMSRIIPDPYRSMRRSIKFHARPKAKFLETRAAVLGNYSKTLASVLQPLRLKQQEIVKQLAAITAPSLRLQKQMATMVSRVALARDDLFVPAFQALSQQVHDYTPSIAVLEDGLSIDGETYTQSAIQQALVQGEILTMPSAWGGLSRAQQWIIWRVLTVFILPWVVFGVAPFAYLRDQQKTEIRIIKAAIKKVPQKEYVPFITKDDLPVYASSKRHSRVLGYLPFRTEVQILKARKKKRWLLIEWNNGGVTSHGWVLGRYVFRPPNYRWDN